MYKWLQVLVKLECKYQWLNTQIGQGVWPWCLVGSTVPMKNAPSPFVACLPYDDFKLPSTFLMNCFVVWLTDHLFSLISSRDHCQRSSPSRTSNTLQAGFEPARNLSSGFVEWSCAVVITTTPRSSVSHIYHNYDKTLYNFLLPPVPPRQTYLPAYLLTPQAKLTPYLSLDAKDKHFI